MPQSQSSTVDPESPQLVDTSEGGISDSEDEGADSGTPELNQLVLTAEEQLDYDSFALASPSVTRAPLWSFAEKTPSGSQTRPETQSATIQAQPVTSTPVKPSSSQIITLITWRATSHLSLWLYHLSLLPQNEQQRTSHFSLFISTLIPLEQVDIASGSYAIHVSHLVEHEALARKTTAAFSSALSIAEYVYNQPEISEESKAGLHHRKLDLVAGSNFAWRTVHNNMLMRNSIALDNLSRTIPPIDSGQKVALLPAIFKDTIPTELSLHPEKVNQIVGTWGTLAVDMFAIVHNTHLSLFLSSVPEP